MGQFARRQRDRADAPEHLPLRAGPISNGEFVPAAESSRDRAINQLIRSSIDDCSATARHGPPTLPAGRRSGGGLAGRLRAGRMRHGRTSPIVADDPAPRSGRHLHRAAARRHRGLPAGAGRQRRVHLRCPHPSRHPERPVGAERPRDGRAWSLEHASRRAAPTLRSSTASTGPPTSTTCSWPATPPWPC